MAFQLVIEKELTPARFAEIGRPYRIFKDEVRGLVAVCSCLEAPRHASKWWHANRLEHRVSIYRMPGMECLGVLPCRCPVDHVTFHTTEPVLLASTGDYDGGYCFFGDLLRFNWEVGDAHRMVCGRAVVAAKYRSDGRIDLLMRPENEEEFAPTDNDGEWPDHWKIGIGLTIEDRSFAPYERAYQQSSSGPDARLDGLIPCVPEDFGFDASVLSTPYFRVANPTEPEMRPLITAGYKAQGGVWDLRAIDAERFVVAREGCLLEIWDLKQGLLRRFEGEGASLEFLDFRGDELLTHVLVRGRPGTNERAVSQLWKFRANELTLWRIFDREYVWCVARDGWLLGADIDWQNRGDRRSVRIAPSGEMCGGPAEADADRYGGRQMFPRGSGELHFIRKPNDGGQRCQWNHQLWVVKQNGEEEELGRQGGQGFDDAVELAIPWDDERFLRVCNRYHIEEMKSQDSLLEFVAWRDRSVEFVVQLPERVTQAVRIPGSDVVLVGHRNGLITAVDVGTRAIVLEQPLTRDGLVSVPSSLAEVGGRIVVGTDDGRLLIVRVV